MSASEICCVEVTENAGVICDSEALAAEYGLEIGLLFKFG
jgi:hypothetical protein